MFILALVCWCTVAAAQDGIIDVPVNTGKTVTTALGLKGLPSGLGSADAYMAVLRISPLASGKKYEATLTYDAGTDIGYAHAWVDGNPFGKEWISFVGIGTGTGTREMRGKQDKFLFSIDPKSTSNTLYLVLRTNKPFTFRFGVNDQLSGVTPNSQDRWGYYFVRDFDADRTAPFLLTRGGSAISLKTAAQGAWIDIPVNTGKTVTTALGLKGLPSGLGSADAYMAVLRISPLASGKKYEATLTYDAGTDIGYAHAWVDGNPFGKEWMSFVGIGTGTGTREMRGKQDKFLFSIDRKSMSNTLYLVLRTNKPFTFRFGVNDQLSGVTTNSQDRWGYYFVRDFDADRTAPFILMR
ncbi:MAG: hypothetical protein CSYNP_00344 [Syntrophus sp. SKADARSKE-3]|nr:hypothetical protein [Syntrophus sp. SKADARSKE-3]